LLPDRLDATAETGCGKSTIFFSNLSSHYTVFCVDDSASLNGSRRFWQKGALTKLDRVCTVLGQRRRILARHERGAYDLVLLGRVPDGWPFPEIEYIQFYPHIRRDGYLLVGDVNIPNIGRVADVNAEDRMWDLIDVVGYTAVFRRTGETRSTSSGMAGGCSATTGGASRPAIRPGRTRRWPV
jgi:hypothetical protein